MKTFPSFLFPSFLGVLLALPATPGAFGAPLRADAVVLVNSHSARYLDFQHLIQPYLDNFGVPYTVQDIATDAPAPSIGNYAVIIIGHNQLDINKTYLTTTVQANLSLAVANGTGLVNFDSDLYTGTTARYQFVQDIFGFTYGSGAAGTSVSLPATEPGSQMHYITARHPANDSVALRGSLSVAGITVPAGATALATTGGRPLVAVKQYGRGRAVQWGGYGWMVSTVLGPVDGLDDVVWRGVVWAARKPFVVRGLPNFVTMRVDDAYGPFDWVHAANAVGFKPFIALFYQLVTEASATDLRALTTSGNATASIHSTVAYTSSFFYFNHATEKPWSDSIQANNFTLGTQWHTSHGIPISKVCATHYSEIGLNAFAGLKAWGMEYVPIEVVPQTIEYASPGAPWLVGGPYRLYESTQPGQVNWPTYYADWLTVPGHPEFNGQFFNIYSEVRDASGCAEWCPDNDVAGSISRATQMAKRSLDSMVLTTIFSHELQYISQVSAGNWQAILQGVANNLASYNPSYVTLDHACQYVRATRTSRLLGSGYDPASGQVTATLSGTADLDTSVYVFVGEDSSISSSFGNVPAFSGTVTDTVAVLSARPVSPAIVNGPASLASNVAVTAVFTVTAVGTAPLSYQWLRNLAPLTNGGRISGATASTLAISNLQPADAGSYTVVVTNVAGAVTSAVATLTVNGTLSITTQPASQSVIVGANVSLTVTASGTAPLSYQWQFNGAAMAGATNTNLTLANAQPAVAGNYAVIVTNSAASVASAVAVLTVLTPPAITTQPQSLTSAAGTAASFSATATGSAPLTYQWRLNGVNLAGGGGISGATTATLTISGLQSADAGNYALVVSNGAGSVTTAVAVLTVTTRPYFAPPTLLPDGSIRLSLSTAPGLACRIDASTNLIDWVTLTNIANPSGTIQFIDPDAANFSKRFYRAVLTVLPSASAWETADIGAVWSDTFDRPTLGANWIVLGGANASIITNQLQFVHANTDTSRQVYYQPWLTSSDQWTLRWSQRFGTNAGTVGVGVGIKNFQAAWGGQGNDRGYNALLYGAGANVGKIALERWDGTSQNLIALGPALTLAASGVVDCSLTLSGWTMSATASNRVNGQVSTTSFVCYSAENLAVPTISRMCFYPFQGTVYVDNLSFVINHRKPARFIVIGASISAGSSASTYAQGYVEVLQRYFTEAVCNDSSGYNSTADSVSLLPEILAHQPGTALLIIGANDLTFGYPATQWQSQYSSLVAQLQANGVEVKHCLPTPETTTDERALKTWILASYPSSDVIDTWTPLLSGAYGLNPAYDSGDGVHPNDAGHLLLGQIIRTNLP